MIMEHHQVSRQQRWYQRNRDVQAARQRAARLARRKPLDAENLQLCRQDPRSSTIPRNARLGKSTDDDTRMGRRRVSSGREGPGAYNSRAGGQGLRCGCRGATVSREDGLQVSIVVSSTQRICQVERRPFSQRTRHACVKKVPNNMERQQPGRSKKLERLRSFFRFARENGWLAIDPSEKLSNPKVTMRPTLSFSQAEMVRILAATTATIEKSHADAKNNAHRLRALVLLLRYTGLRIGDAVSCSVERLSDGKLRLYTQKTGTHVHCPLPEFVVRELDSIPKRSEHYWFWTGNCKLKTAVSDKVQDRVSGRGCQSVDALRPERRGNACCATA
jgi:hypothetical protein